MQHTTHQKPHKSLHFYLHIAIVQTQEDWQTYSQTMPIADELMLCIHYTQHSLFFRNNNKTKMLTNAMTCFIHYTFWIFGFFFYDFNAKERKKRYLYLLCCAFGELVCVCCYTQTFCMYSDCLPKCDMVWLVCFHSINDRSSWSAHLNSICWLQFFA